MHNVLDNSSANGSNNSSDNTRRHIQFTKAQLSYCSNVHPGESLPEVVDNIKQHFSAVRESRQLSNMASGLWLSAKAAQTLLTDDGQLTAFKCLIKQQGLLLTSLNGFPYGNFHQKVVKNKVYFPTWAHDERSRYTEHLATILSACLPAEVSCGVISTVPLAYAEQWTQKEHQQAINHLIQLSHYLQALEQSSGKRIVVCLEMEPDCVLESSAQLLHFFNHELLPAAQAQGVDPAIVLRYIGCCFDTCHQAVMGENINEVLTAIYRAGITLGKIQISNAISAQLSSNDAIDQLCTLFEDGKFLHQTKVFREQKLLAALPDLCRDRLKVLLAEQSQVTSPDDNRVNNQVNSQENAAISAASLTAKIHYHVPIHQHQFELDFLTSSQEAILSTLTFLKQHPDCRPSLEIETYTWLNFLTRGSSQTDNLHQGLLAEFIWLESQLVEQQLLTNTTS